MLLSLKPDNEMRILFIFFYFVFCSIAAYAHPYAHPDSWNNPKILEILKTSKISSMESMRDYLSRTKKSISFNNKNVFLVTFEGGIKAVFKAFPKDDQSEAQAEVAAYNASLHLGFPKIPPTVLRELDGKKGSLQLYVDTKIDLGQEGQFNEFIKTVSKDDLANLNLFYFVFGQWDTDPHNVMGYQAGAHSYLIAIDNADIADPQHVRYGERPFVKVIDSKALDTQDFDKPFPFDQAKLERIDTLKKTYAEKLPKSFYTRFKVKQLSYVVHRNAFWRQFYVFEKDAVIQPFSPYAPPATLEKLKALDKKAIKDIFNVGEKIEFLTDEYVDSILGRRDQVLRYFEKK